MKNISEFVQIVVLKQCEENLTGNENYYREKIRQMWVGMALKYFNAEIEFDIIMGFLSLNIRCISSASFDYLKIIWKI